MAQLVKVEDHFFNEIYVGEKITPYINRKVTCILDDNCVRYVVVENGKRVKRCEYKNQNKALCFKNAEKALDPYNYKEEK